MVSHEDPGGCQCKPDASTDSNVCILEYLMTKNMVAGNHRMI